MKIRGLANQTRFFAMCAAFALPDGRMNWFQIYLRMSDDRDCGFDSEKVEYYFFCSPLNSAVNFEPRPNADCHKPSRFDSLAEPNHPVFNHDNHLTFVWRML